MKRAEFLERLMQALAFMTAEERRSVREYYEELLDDALEAGEAEEAVLAGFGAPEEIAQRIKAEYVPQELTGAATGGTTAAQQETKLVCVHSETATVGLSGADVAKPQVTWSNMDEWDQIEVAEENGILRVQHIRRAPLRIGLLFTIINRQIQIEVPREYAGSVQVETKNGAIRLEEMKQLAQVGCHARNGAVRMAGCCVQALAIEARNGAVKLEDCETGSLAVQAFNGAVHLQRCAGGSAKVQGHNGAVRLAGCQFARLLELGSQNGAIQVQESGPADCIRLLNKNGSITAEILDKEEAYSIDTHTANGRCTPPTCLRPNAGKTLYAHTVNGRVTIAFCG